MRPAVVSLTRTFSPVVRQCAWCWLVADASGQYRIEAHRKLDAASHGICPECRTGWVRRARASLQPARI
jgi:hypothetical protein